MKRIALALLSSVAALSWPLAIASAAAEDVTINLDALGKSEPAKPVVKSPPLRPDAVRSEVVADDPVDPPVPAVKPRPKVKPVLGPAAAAPEVAAPKTPVKTAAPKKPSAPSRGEIDFIAKTKRKSGPEAAPAVEAVAPPAKPVQSAPLTPLSDVALDPEPVVPPAAMALPTEPTSAPLAKPILTSKPAVAPKPPAAVKVNTGALDAPAGAQAGRPSGTPLTAIAPDGALYIPKNVEALPQPVSAPSGSVTASEPDPDEVQPLTLPPGMPEAPPPAAAAPSTQTIAAVTPAAAPVAAARANATLARASVLAGYATAAELKFESGQDALTPESQASLDQLAQSFKAAGMRVQLAAYSGPPGNNSSDARRLSLKRALAVREYLAGQGVQKLMVNIAAFGGPALGATDRVDVMVRSDKLPDAQTP
jgi:outer membrane protein OmpA-like peptidoglycan-associated protein